MRDKEEPKESLCDNERWHHQKAALARNRYWHCEHCSTFRKPSCLNPVGSRAPRSQGARASCWNATKRRTRVWESCCQLFSTVHNLVHTYHQANYKVSAEHTNIDLKDPFLLASPDSGLSGLRYIRSHNPELGVCVIPYTIWYSRIKKASNYSLGIAFPHWMRQICGKIPRKINLHSYIMKRILQMWHS